MVPGDLFSGAPSPELGRTSGTQLTGQGKTISFLNPLSRLVRSVSLSVPSLVLLNGSSSFSFYLTCSVSMTLGETIIYHGLEGVFLCRGIPVQTACPVFLVQGQFSYGCQPCLSSECAGSYPFYKGYG